MCPLKIFRRQRKSNEGGKEVGRESGNEIDRNGRMDGFDDRRMCPLSRDRVTERRMVSCDQMMDDMNSAQFF